jgi:hypothetical protein
MTSEIEGSDWRAGASFSSEARRGSDEEIMAEEVGPDENDGAVVRGG